MLELYGLTNCDRCRAARKWLETNGLGVQFVDLRQNPPPARELTRWVEQLGWQVLLNRRSRTWRELPDEKRSAVSKPLATQLMRAHPTLIKRPVLVRNSQLHVGFTPEHYQEIFGVSG